MACSSESDVDSLLSMHGARGGALRPRARGGGWRIAMGMRSPHVRTWQNTLSFCHCASGRSSWFVSVRTCARTCVRNVFVSNKECSSENVRTRIRRRGRARAASRSVGYVVVSRLSRSSRFIFMSFQGAGSSSGSIDFAQRACQQRLTAISDSQQRLTGWERLPTSVRTYPWLRPSPRLE